EKVTVEANPIAVQADSGDVSHVITGQQITQLSTNGRSVYSLFAMTPGASSLQADFVIPTAVSGDSNVSINGQRSGHNLQLIDGGENLDRGGSSGSVMPSLDAIAEFRNMTSNYSAEYGASSAATITEVVKSGSKQFHASAWEFNRNDALDARNYFNRPPQKVAELRFNTYGFNVGGPVEFHHSDNPKTFFFYNMEWRKLIQGGVLNLTEPLTSTYGGDFGATAINVPTVAQVAPAVLFQNCPGGTAPAGVTQGSPFPGNAIPACMLNANAQTLLTAGGKYGGIFPAPNNGAQFQGGNNSPTNVREEIARVDHTFNDKFSVFGHWISEQTAQTYGTTQWSGDNQPSVSDVFNNPSYSAVVHTTYVISPTLLNEASFNYNGNRIHIIPQGLVAAPSGFTFNRLFTGPNNLDRIPGINLGKSTGANYTSNSNPWVNKADDYQFRDDISWTKGAHQIKFGASWAIYKKGQDAFSTTQGSFTFNGGFTGNDFADYLLGLASGYSENGTQIHGQWNNDSYGAYIQDNWRATHRLTLNLGLRWDGLPHTYEANNLSSNFYPNLYNPANAATFDSNGHICSVNSNPVCAGGPSPGLGTSPNPILAGISFYENGIGIGGQNGIPAGLVNNHWANFGPRIGFAYDLTGSGKTILRGGFGTMYERIQGNDMYNGANNVPQGYTANLQNVSLSNPGLSLSNGAAISAASLPVLPPSITGIAVDNYKQPTSYQYSLGIQQQLGAKSVLGISYVGSQDRHESYNQEVNLPNASLLPALTAVNGNGRDLDMNFLGYDGITLYQNGANSHYNSLQVDLHGNLRNDLQYQFGYTYSRAIDALTGTGSGGDLTNVTNPYAGWRYDIGPSPWDRTQIAFINFVYQVPFLKNSDNHFLKTAIGGWELSGIITMDSGQPVNIGVNGQNVASAVPNSGNRPDVTGKISYPHTVAAWFNPSVFSMPAPGTYGNLGSDAVRAPGRDNWNLSLFKSFVISEARGSRFEFRAESFNTWNHTQYTGTSNNLGSSNFGQVTSAADPRVFQLGAKLIF
ncbi:MAG TPA: TonB-dependent receptor, partial [Terriglobales bacterium]